MSSIQYVAQVAGHISHATMMILLLGGDANDLVKYGVVAVQAFLFVTEHSTNLLPESAFAVLDPLVTVLFLGLLFRGMYKKHSRVTNKLFVKALIGGFVVLYALFIAVDFPGLPKDAYADRLAQLHTSTYDNNHHVLHVLLFTILYVMNSATDSAATAAAAEGKKDA
jgi:hypothetical protein